MINYLLLEECQKTMKSKDRWVNSKTSIYNLGYHIIWCPKYRRKVLVGDIETRLKELIRIKCTELDCEVCEIEVMPDHVHLFVKTIPTIAPHFLVQQIKGWTARVLRDEFKELKSKLPNMWTRSYYVESVGNFSEDTMKQYIQEQKNK